MTSLGGPADTDLSARTVVAKCYLLIAFNHYLSNFWLMFQADKATALEAHVFVDFIEINYKF